MPIISIWYLLFGFVGLAYKTRTMRKTKLSNLFLYVTMPVTLVPFRKAFYYWTKAINISLRDPDNTEIRQKVLDAAIKVNPNHLYADNNKAMFYSFLSAVFLDVKDVESARMYLDKAKALPHSPELNTMIDKLDSLFEESKGE